MCGRNLKIPQEVLGVAEYPMVDHVPNLIRVIKQLKPSVLIGVSTMAKSCNQELGVCGRNLKNLKRNFKLPITQWQTTRPTSSAPSSSSGRPS